MNSEERTRLWARDTQWLRRLSGQIGWFTAVWTAIMVLVAMSSSGSAEQFLASLVGLAPLTVVGIFMMACGRVLATMAEIAWFSSPENPENAGPEPASDSA